MSRRKVVVKMYRKMKRFFFVICLFSLVPVISFGQTEKVNKDYDTSVKIISKPRASYPEQKNGTTCVQGSVILRVQFLENGEIGKIAVVSGLPDGFNDKAIEAAKKIKFKPAMNDGKPVTVSKQIQYSFSLY